MDRRQHWQTLYTTRDERDASWFEPLPAASLQMLEAAGLTPDSCVIDVGGGDSRLVDALVARGLHCLAVLDVSGAALARARERLGPAGDRLTWIEADVTGDWAVPPRDIWHDRAVFHFLTAAADRARYVARLRQVLKPGGSAIIAAFAPHGPDRCSGLPVVRYSPGSLAAEIGEGFRIAATAAYDHRTPGGTVQPFVYVRLLREDESGEAAGRDRPVSAPR